jgi:hypothetical protein
VKISTDRLTRGLLLAIVVLLAVLVVRPMLPTVAPQARAQSEVPIDLGFKVLQPSMIAVPTGQIIREIQVMDQAQCFLVRYDNRIEVYRVQVLSMTPTSLQGLNRNR